MSSGASTHADLPELPGYEVEARLGSGSMGSVYRARRGGEIVALKVLHPHLAGRRGMTARFRREVEAGSRIRHPHVVRSTELDLRIVDGHPYFLIEMEYVEGRSLREELQRRSRLPDAHVREIARQTASGLAAIHAAGLVHRDLKPENLLLDRRDRVRIADLGQARSAAAGQRTSFSGSAPYAAPEQLDGEPPRPESDLYALGVVLYELVAGINPFRHESLTATSRAHRGRRPRPLRDLDGRVTSFLSLVVDTLLARAPERRFRTAAELVDVLTQAERSPWWRRHREAFEPTRTRAPLPVRQETPLRGRAPELDTLRAAAHDALHGRSVVCRVRGVGGSGKTRLLQALVSELPDHVAFLHVDARTSPYPFRAAAEAWVDRHGGAETGAARWLVEAQRYPGDLPARLLVRATAGMPVVWAIDDRHALEPDQAARLHDLVRLLDGRPSLVVLTERPGAQRDAEAPELDRDVDLAPLDLRAVQQILDDALGSAALAQRIAPVVRRRSDGLPYFVLEIVRVLRTEGLVVRLADGTHVSACEPEDIPVPGRLADAVSARLDQLDGTGRRIVEALALADGGLRPDVLARLLDLPPLRTLDAIGVLAEREGLARMDGERCRLDHALLAEVAAARMPPARRRALHAQLARALRAAPEAAASDEADLAACRHAFLGGTDTGAATVLLDAVDRALRAGRLGVAQRFARDLLRHESDLTAEQAVRARITMAGCMWDGNGAPETVRLCAGAVETADRDGTAELRARARVAFAAACGSAVGTLECGVAALDEAERLAAAGGVRGLDVAIGSVRSRFLVERGRTDEALALLEVLRARDDLGADAEEHVSVLRRHALALEIVGRDDEARATLEDAIATARDGATPTLLSGAELALGMLHLRRGERRRGRRALRAAYRSARAVGNRSDEANAVIGVAHIQFETGRLAAAERLLRESVDLVRELGALALEAQARLNLALTQQRLGRPAAAEAQRAQAWECGAPGLRRPIVRQMRVVDAMIHEGAGDHDRALAAYTRALEGPADGADLRAFAESRMGCIRLFVLHGHGDGYPVRAWGDELRDEERIAAIPRLRALRAVHEALLDRGRANAAVRELAEAIPQLPWCLAFDGAAWLAQGTGNSDALALARRLLDDALRVNPTSARDAMLRSPATQAWVHGRGSTADD